MLRQAETFQNGLFSSEFAESMDIEDELSCFKSEFTFPHTKNGNDVVYLCGNSLGIQPKGIRKHISDQLDKWDLQAVEGHFTGETTLCRPLHFSSFT